MTYEEQLKTPQWYAFRDKIMKRDNYKCQRCNSIYSLQVHHKEYIDGKMAWEYEGVFSIYVVTLCEQCHGFMHGKPVPMHELQVALDRLVAVAGGMREWHYQNPSKNTDAEEIH